MASVATTDVLSTRFMAVRRGMRRARSLALFLRRTRAVVHFGPWRHAARAVVRALHPPQTDTSHTDTSLGTPTLLPGIDVQTVCTALRTDGVCVAGQLPPSTLATLRAVTDALPRGEYGQFHMHDATVRALLSDPDVRAVLRAHLGAEPELLECTVVVHEPLAGELVKPDPQRHFHFDFAGWQSLNLFVYLSDVTPDSGPHQIAVGTHRDRRLADALVEVLDDSVALPRFDGRIRTITGPAGTLFFEDTEAFHRRGSLTERRAMLNVLFASHRGLFSRGRLARSYGTYLENSARRAELSAAAAPEPLAPSR